MTRTLGTHRFRGGKQLDHVPYSGTPAWAGAADEGFGLDHDVELAHSWRSSVRESGWDSLDADDVNADDLAYAGSGADSADSAWSVSGWTDTGSTDTGWTDAGWTDAGRHPHDGRDEDELWGEVSPWVDPRGVFHPGSRHGRQAGPRDDVRGGYRARDISEEIPHPIERIARQWGRSRARLWMFLVTAALTAILLPTVFSDRTVSVDSAKGGEDAGVSQSAAAVGGGAGLPGAASSEAAGGIDRPEAGLASTMLSRFGGATTDSWGDGNVPRSPRATSTMVQRAMCSVPQVGDAVGYRCGLGWLSQPLVMAVDSKPALVFGGYDSQLHIVDVRTATDVRNPLPTSGVVEGALALDPDGFGLVYAGTDQGVLSIIALDRGKNPEVLWTFDLASDTSGLWSNSFSGAPLIVEDHLIVGAGNGRLYSFSLGRTRGSDGTVTVTPKLVHSLQTWNDELLAQLPDRRIGVSGGVTLVGNRIYMANEGGRVLGWNLADLLAPGEPRPAFRWTAPDVVAAPLAPGPDGTLLVPVARERRGPADVEVGPVVLLDPSRAGNPVAWTAPGDVEDPSGSVATPLYAGEWVIATTDNGVVSGYDAMSGAHVWSLRLSGPLRSTPIIQGNSLIVADCAGRVTNFDLRTNPPTKRWAARVGGCVESTPTVWGGNVFVATADGFVHRLADREE
jgi:hypothetical protein